MQLYIKVENGNPINHPLLKENVQTVFPDIDFTNLPDWLANFERVSAPVIGPYEKNQRNQYEFIGEIVKDVWYTDPMTTEEIIEKQNSVKQYWKEHGFPSWQFDETTCEFNSPVPYPADSDNYYEWDETGMFWAIVDS